MIARVVDPVRPDLGPGSGQSRYPVMGPAVTRSAAGLLGGALAAVVGLSGSGWGALVVALAAVVVAGLPPRVGDRARAVLALLLGLAGVIAGIGIGVPNLVMGADAALAVTGLASLGAGAGLVGIATAALLRGQRLLVKLGAVPVGAAIVVLLLMPLTFAVLVTTVPPFELGAATPADVGLSYEDVSIQADDGVQLAGWYLPSTNGAAVVLLSGAGGVRSRMLDHAKVLARHGYGVLLLDVRGHGGSEGDAMLWGWDGDRDIRAGIDYIEARPDVEPARIGAVGLSMGAEEAAGGPADG